MRLGPSKGSRLAVVRQKRPIVRDERGYIVDLGQDLSIRRLVLIGSKKGSIRGGHYHRKAGHFVYVLSGRLTLELRDGGRAKILRLVPGRLVWIPPLVQHTFRALQDSCCLEFSEQVYSPGDSVRGAT